MMVFMGEKGLQIRGFAIFELVFALKRIWCPLTHCTGREFRILLDQFSLRSKFWAESSATEMAYSLFFGRSHTKARSYTTEELEVSFVLHN